MRGRLHHRQFVARWIGEVEPPSAWKGRDLLRDPAPCPDHRALGRLQIRNLDHRQRRRCFFPGIALQTDIGIAGRGRGIAGSESGQRPAERLLVECFRRRDIIGGQFHVIQARHGISPRWFLLCSALPDSLRQWRFLCSMSSRLVAVRR